MENKIYPKIKLLLYSINGSVEKLEYNNASYSISSKFFIINEHITDGDEIKSTESTPYDMDIVHRFKTYNTI